MSKQEEELVLEVDYKLCKFNIKPSDEIVSLIRFELRYKIEGAKFFKPKWARYKKGADEEYKYLYDKRSRTFPSGLLSKVEKILKENDIKYEIKDLREDKPLSSNPLPLLGKGLRDYQIDAEQKALEARNCVIKIPTGGGKTLIFTSMIGKLNGYNIIVLVRRQLLLMQTIEEFQENLGIEVGQIGVGKVDIKPVTVAMIQTIAKALDPKHKVKFEDDDIEEEEEELTEDKIQLIKDYLPTIEVLIADECHGIPADTAQLVINSVEKSAYNAGFSATPWRSDGKDILIEALTGPRVVDITASHLIERGYLVPPHIYYLKTPDVRVPKDKQGTYQEVYKKYVVENEERNQLIFSTAKKAYEKFEHILILVNQIDHGMLLLEKFEKEGIWSEYVHGADSISKRKDAINRFTSKTRSVLISSSILNEGINIPEITTLINAAGLRSSSIYYQKIGRAIRLCDGKKRAIVVDFLDESIRYMDKQAKERLRILKTEPLYKLIIQGENDKK